MWGRSEATFETAEVPSYPEQMGSRHWLFRDPRQEQNVADFYACYAETAADAMLSLCQAVKDETDGEKLTGAFFGYLMELSWNNCFFNDNFMDREGSEVSTVQRSGHLGLGKALRSPTIDFFVSPYGYAFRGVGGDGLPMQPTESLRQHGKLYLLEEDTLMHNNFDPDKRMHPVEHSIAIYQRNFAQVVTHGNKTLTFAAPLSGSYPAGARVFGNLLDPGSEIRWVLANRRIFVLKVYLAIGVENPSGVGTAGPLRGEVWFNELRVIGVDDTPGWAYRFDGQAKLADFGSVSFNYSRIDPYFHSLEQRFGSRQESKSWGVSAAVQVEKLLPDDWVRTSIPISYTHTESAVDPRYLPNSDVLVQEAADRKEQQILDQGGTAEAATSESERIIYESQSRRVSETYAAPTFRISLPSKWWVIRDTFNKLTYGFTYTRSNERAPALVYREAWNWNVRLGYSITLPPEHFILEFINQYCQERKRMHGNAKF